MAVHYDPGVIATEAAEPSREVTSAQVIVILGQIQHEQTRVVTGDVRT